LLLLQIVQLPKPHGPPLLVPTWETYNAALNGLQFILLHSLGFHVSFSTDPNSLCSFTFCV